MSGFGLDSIVIGDKRLNLLFGALMFSMIGVFAVGNLFARDGASLAGSLWISLSCFGVAALIYAFSRSLSSLAWGVVLAFSLLSLVVLFHSIWFTAIVYGAMLVSSIYMLNHLRFDASDIPFLLVAAAFSVLTVFGVERAYTTFDMLPRLHAGVVHRDTLFHGAIAGMIKTYGVSSTGLHGLVDVPYHVFSHVLVAAISSLSRQPVLDVYGVAPWVLFAPMLIFGVAACVSVLDRSNHRIPVFWCLTCGALALTPELLWYLTNDNYFVSESYLVALALFMIGLPLLYKHPLGRLDLLLLFLISLFISGSKLSVGLVWSSMWCARALFHKEGRRDAVLAAAVVGVATVYIGFDWIVDAMNQRVGAGYLDIVKSRVLEHVSGVFPRPPFLSVFPASIVHFLMFYYVFSWAALAYTHRNIGSSMRPYGRLAATYVLAGVGVGFLTNIVLKSNDSHYFSNVAFFIALPVVVMAANSFLTDIGSQVVRRLLMLSLMCLMVVYNLDAYHGRLHKTYYPAYGGSARLGAEQENQLVSRLAAIRKSTGAKVVVAYPEGWAADHPLTFEPWCNAKPFLFPAVSERAWIGAIQIEEGCDYAEYGYHRYWNPGAGGGLVTPIVPEGFSVIQP